MTGVSTDIGTSFVRPAGRVGHTLHVKATLIGLGLLYLQLHRAIFIHLIGKSLAYTRIDFTNPAGELVAYGCKF